VENAINAAENITALRPVADAFDKGVLRFKRDFETMVPGPDATEKQWKLREQLDAKSDEVVTVNLTLFDISGDEIKAAKIRPVDLAALRPLFKTKPAK